MVFHRFIGGGVTIRLGASAIPGWDPFEGGVLKDAETLEVATTNLVDRAKEQGLREDITTILVRVVAPVTPGPVTPA